MKKFDSLIRVSKMNGREESAETTLTIRDQRDGNRQAAAEAGARIVREHKALDQSGRTIHRSKAYREILERVRSGATDGIVVAYGDRLTRNWRGVGPFYDELEQAGAEVVIAGLPGVDYRTATGRMVTGMMAVVSDMVGAQSKERGDRIADATIARGVPNAVAYGYRRNGTFVGRECVEKVDPKLDGKALVRAEEQARVVVRIFEMRLDGYRWADIVRTLNEAGIPSPKGGLWTDATVYSIVRNEVYTGVVRLGERRVERAHEALVSRADWKRAQKTRTVKRHGRLVSGIAGGLLVCSGCRRPLSVNGYPQTVYGCRRATSAGTCPRPVYVSKARADEFVERLVEDVLSEEKLAPVSSSRDRARQRARVKAAAEELEAFVVHEAALDTALFAAGVSARQAKLAEEQAVADELDAHAEATEGLPTLDGWHELKSRKDLDGQRRTARSLIDSIVVAPPASRSKRTPVDERFTIRWRGSGGEDASSRR